MPGLCAHPIETATSDKLLLPCDPEILRVTGRIGNYGRVLQRAASNAREAGLGGTSHTPGCQRVLWGPKRFVPLILFTDCRYGGKSVADLVLATGPLPGV